LVSSVSISAISQLILENDEQLTNSASGFIGYLERKAGFIISPAMIRGTLEPSPNKHKTNIFKKPYGSSGWVLQLPAVFFLTNTTPDNPRFAEAAPSDIAISGLSAPALIGTELAGQVAVANLYRK